MQSFIPYKLNEACRNKDKTKIKTFGPFAFVLQKIIFYAQMQSEKFNPYDTNSKHFAYRGIQLPIDLIN
jgi:hypothetical protein